MDVQKVDMFIITNGKYFPTFQLPYIKDRLLQVDDSKWVFLHSSAYKDPTIMLIISILFGVFGVDRFMLGNIGLGILKLITLGGCGIWEIIDWFWVMKATREKNFKTLQQIMFL
jgi:TM2 domain-containing membrane protein YozV